MIEIGNERSFATGARRAASTFETMGALLILVWLLRGYLGLTDDSAYILAISIGFGFFGRLFRTKTNSGVTRAASSFFGNIAVQSILTIVLIWFLEWIASIQSPSLPPAVQFPTIIGQQVPNLVILALSTALVSLGARGISPGERNPLTQGPALVVKSTASIDLGRVKLSPKKDTIALPIKRFRRTLGAMVYGDLLASFETPLGTVTGVVRGPVTTMGVPFKGERADKDLVSNLVGKTVKQLAEETEVDPSMPRGDSSVGSGESFPWSDASIDIPFVHVSKGADGESVEVGPVTVRRSAEGQEEVKVGPFSITSGDWDRMSWGRAPRTGRDKTWYRKPKRSGFSTWWLAKGNRGTSYAMTASFNGIDARWNGSSLRLRGEWMQMKAGSDGFTYSPDEVHTHSPLHNLHITQTKATLNSRKFTLDIHADKVVLRTDGGTKVTDSLDLAKDMMEFLAETAKKQIKSVMEGQPIELDEMLSRTEEVLKKYE